MQSETAVSSFGTNFQKVMYNQQTPPFNLRQCTLTLDIKWYFSVFLTVSVRDAGCAGCCCSILPGGSCQGCPSAVWAARLCFGGFLPLRSSWWLETIKLLSPSGDEDWQFVGDESKVADEKIHPDNCCNCTLRMQLLSQSIRQWLLVNLYLAVNFILCLKSKKFLHET